MLNPLKYNYSPKNLTIKSILLFSFIYLFFIYSAFGIYFDDWEVLPNAFLTLEFTNTMGYDWLPNVWTFFPPVISYLSQFFPNFYSFLHLLIVLYNLTISVHLLNKYFSFKKLEQRYFFLIISAILFIPIIYYVSQRSSTIWLCFNASFLFLTFLNDKKRALLFFCILTGIIGLIIRFELVFFFCFFLLFFSIFFNKKLFKFALFSFALSLCAILLFNKISFLFFDNYYYVEKAERYILDRNLFSFSQVSTFTDKESLLKNAIYLYIQDQSIFDDYVYKEIVTNNPSIHYLLSKSIINSFFNNFLRFLQDLKNYSFIILGSLIFFLISIIISKNRVKIALVLISFLILTLSVLTFYFMPSTLWMAFLTIISIYILVLSLKNKSILKYRFLILLIFISSTLLFLNQNYKLNKEKEDTYITYRNLYTDIKLNNYDIVFSYLTPDFQNLSNKTFNNSKKSIKHYYLDFFFHSRYSFFTSYNNDFFDGKNNSLVEKIKICHTKKVAFFVDANYKVFLKNYLKVYHNLIIDFEEIDGVDYEYLNKNNILSIPYIINAR